MLRSTKYSTFDLTLDPKYTMDSNSCSLPLSLSNVSQTGWTFSSLVPNTRIPSSADISDYTQSNLVHNHPQNQELQHHQQHQQQHHQQHQQLQQHQLQQLQQQLILQEQEQEQDQEQQQQHHHQQQQQQQQQHFNHPSPTEGTPWSPIPKSHPTFKPSFYDPFQVNRRRRTSREQHKTLEDTFQANRKPNSKVRHALADQLCMPVRSVQVWFQNRRAKAKLQDKQVPNEQATVDTPTMSQANNIISAGGSGGGVPAAPWTNAFHMFCPLVSKPKILENINSPLKSDTGSRHELSSDRLQALDDISDMQNCDGSGCDDDECCYHDNKNEWLWEDPGFPLTPINPAFLNNPAARASFSSDQMTFSPGPECYYPMVRQQFSGGAAEETHHNHHHHNQQEHEIEQEQEQLSEYSRISAEQQYTWDRPPPPPPPPQPTSRESLCQPLLSGFKQITHNNCTTSHTATVEATTVTNVAVADNNNNNNNNNTATIPTTADGSWIETPALAPRTNARIPVSFGYPNPAMTRQDDIYWCGSQGTRCLSEESTYDISFGFDNSLHF